MDDNSLIKKMPYTLQISAPGNSLYDGRRIGKGFVASHVWRILPDGRLAARERLTYSFVPNLIWLPREVSKLTDREGSFAQTYLQALSFKLFRGQPVTPGLQQLVDRAWKLLPEPTSIPQEGLPSEDELNFFLPSVAFVARRLKDLDNVIDALAKARDRTPIRRKVVAPRYGAGLPTVPKASLERLHAELTRYAAAIGAAEER